MSESVARRARPGTVRTRSLYDLFHPLPAGRQLASWLPEWAIPPAYGYTRAEAVLVSAVLSDHPGPAAMAFKAAMKRLVH